MARPLRSWMFVPGNRQRFLDKIYELETPPDAVFFDLEDGVLPEEKPAARELIAETLRRAIPGPLRTVRVNAVGTKWLREDLEAILVPGLEGVCVPKVESADDVRAVASALDGFDPDSRVRIVAAIESAAGLLKAPEIAAAHGRVLAIMFGAEDYALDLGLGTRREGEAAELVYARSALVVAAAAARVLSIDGVFPDLEDAKGLEADVEQARRLGFDAKSTFNPRQIGLINERFSPTADELAYARRVAAAFEEAVARGDASVAVGGQLVDRPIVLRAQRLLELADELGIRTTEGSA
ncbi:MAG TPA: CoA ester lyase [Gaiellaceae bacterium]|nr:CoA ester lyase [Gaiellaceae bacterium]